jgi:hypothetical protein
LFFEIYKSDQPTFKSSEQDTTEVPREIVILDQNDVESGNVVVTNWNQTDSLDMLLFPNPASDIVHVKVYSDLLIGSEWQIVNAQGQEIQTGILNGYTMSIDLANYTDGIYLFKLISNNVKYEYKIIKS